MSESEKETPTLHPDPSSPADAGAVAHMAELSDAIAVLCCAMTQKDEDKAVERINALFLAAEARGAARGQQEIERLQAALASIYRMTGAAMRWCADDPR